MQQRIGPPIRERAIYTYEADWPAGCRGHRYRVECFATAVPQYQQVVVVRCLTGPDEGLTITCSLANFAGRYRLADDEAAAGVADAGKR